MPAHRFIEEFLITVKRSEALKLYELRMQVAVFTAADCKVK